MSSNLVIVALPADDDPVWKVSSEKKPHLTICFLGDANSNPHVDRIMLFVEHAVQIAARGPFYLEVDHREVLGPDKADVLMFRKDWSFRWLNCFRNQLLQNNDIKAGYESVEQYPEYQPHLTLGYPPTPAHEDKMPEYGINMVRFDRIGVWTGDYEGPDWRLEWPEMEMGIEAAWSVDMDLERQAAGMYTLQHHGVKGMKWGVRKEDVVGGAKSAARVIGKAAIATGKVADDVLFELQANHEETASHITVNAHDKFKEGLPALKAQHPTGGKTLNRLKNPLSPESKAYRRDAKKLYLKGLEDSANEMTNLQGTRRYTLKESGEPNTSKYFWTVNTEAIPVKHAATIANGVVSDTFRVHPIFDDDGYIIDLELVADTMAQSVSFGETFIGGLLDNDALTHHGIKGMRWGFRKSPPAAVAPTATSKVSQGIKGKTKVHVQGGENHPAHEDAIKVAEARAKLRKSGPAALSNNELRDVANRLQLENQVAVLTSSKGKQFVSRTLQNESQNLARAGVQKGVKAGGKHVVKKAGRAAATTAATAALL